MTYDLRISAKNICNSFFFNIGVLATCLPVILAYSMKRSDNFSDTTFFKYDFPLRLKNFSQKYLKSFFFNIGGITYWSPGHFGVFHEKIRQVFSYLERYRRFRRRPVYYSTFNTVRVRRDLRLENFSQKYLKFIFFNIGGITYWSPGHFAVFHEKICQVFSYLERYRRFRRRPVNYSTFNTVRV